MNASNLIIDIALGSVVHWNVLLQLRENWRITGKTVVWTNGCFDIFHAGHVQSLQAARQLGDILVVGVNSDASVQLNKGPHRPVIPQEQRAKVVASIRYVDFVVIFDESTPEHALKLLKPDIHCKGADYAPPTGKPIPEKSFVESYGGKVAFLPFTNGLSTTDIISKFQAKA